jgi:translocation and assembly module TamB
MDFQAHGSLDEKWQKVQGEFVLSCEDLIPIGKRLDVNSSGTLKMEGRFSGRVLQPEASLHISLNALELNKHRMDTATTNVYLAFLGPLGNPFPGFRLAGDGIINNLTLYTSPPLPPQDLSWTLAASGSLQGIIDIRHFQVTGEGFSVTLEGSVDTNGPKGTLDARLNIADLKPFHGIIPLEIPGSLGLQATLSGDAKALSLRGNVKGNLKIADLPASSPLSSLGKEITYGGDLIFTEEDGLSISGFHVDSAVGILDGSVTYQPATKTLNGSWSVSVPELGHLSPVMERSVSGSLSLRGQAKGPLNMIAIDAEGKGLNLQFEGLRFQEVNASMRALRLQPAVTGRMVLEISEDQHRISGKTKFEFQDSSVVLSSLMIEGPGIALSGNVTLDLRQILVHGDLQGRCEDLRTLSVLVPERIEGSADLEARFRSANRQQHITLELTVKNLNGFFGRASQMRLTGDVSDAFGAPHGSAKLQITELSREDLAFDALELRAEGNARRISFTGTTNGRYKEHFRLESSGIFSTSGDDQRIELSRFSGTWGEIPIALQEPTTILQHPTGRAFKTCVLNIGSGRLEGSGQYERESVSVNLTFHGIPLRVMNVVGFPDLSGSATGHMVFLGSAAHQAGRFAISIKEFGLRRTQLRSLPPGALKASADFQEGRLRVEMILEELTPEPLLARLDLPLSLTMSPFALSAPPDGPLNGNLSGRIDLALIHALAGLDDQTLEGQMDLQLGLNGTVDGPRMKGSMRVEKGRYENFRSGTVLEDIELEVAPEFPRLRIIQGKATDGESGAVSLTGWLDIRRLEHFPFKIEILLDQAKLVRLDNATVTAEGRLNLSGSLSGGSLMGKVNIGPAEIRIPERLPPEMTEIETIEFPVSEEELKTARIAERSRKPDLKFDVRVASSSQVFIRGRGLQSEWRGEVQVTGMLREPVIMGALSLVRGRFNFLGKRFALVSGMVSFGGTTPPSPTLDVRARADTSDITVFLELKGPASAPLITMSSEPSFPSDEILSRLLFGRSAAAISPFQALQLASALNTLKGGPGSDFMGQTRKLLGVDQLELKQSEGNKNETTLSAGKYLSEKVFLEVEKGIGNESDKARLEWEVTPNISVETEVGVNAEGGVGLKWKWSY